MYLHVHKESIQLSFFYEIELASRTFQNTMSSRCSSTISWTLIFLMMSLASVQPSQFFSLAIHQKKNHVKPIIRNCNHNRLISNRRGISAWVPNQTPFRNVKRILSQNFISNGGADGSILAPFALGGYLSTGQCNHPWYDRNSNSNKNNIDAIQHSRNIHSILQLSRGGGSTDAGNNGANHHENEKTNISKKMKKITYAVSLSLIITMIALKKDAILSFDFKGELAKQLEILSSMGTKGLITYIISFLLWELIVGVTTPVETAAGMAFGFQKGILANAIGKTSGAILAFLIGRFVLKDYVTEKLQDNEYMDLVKHSITERPIRVALIWRFSFLPEQIKNFGLAILPVQTWQFVTAVLLHGFPFTLLWTFMGNEMGLVVKGVVDQPSKILKLLIVGVNVLGFFVSPSLVAMWVKGLRDEKIKRDEMKGKAK